MTDSSMNFGPAWIRNMSSEGSSTPGGGSGGPNSSSRYQLADYRYGREEMLALYDKSVRPPVPLATFKTLFSEQAQIPLALLPTSEDEQRGWQVRPSITAGAARGRGGPLERGGRAGRGRGGYAAYGRASPAYDSGWGNGEQPDWSPRKDFSAQRSMDNWRRGRSVQGEEDDGWRGMGPPPGATRGGAPDKWGRSTSWRGEGDTDERNGPPPATRASWHENSRGGALRRSWENEDHLPEWATENPTEGGGTFDERGAFHGSDDEDHKMGGGKREMLQKSSSQQHILNKSNHNPLTSSKSAVSLTKFEEHDKPKEDSSGKEGNQEAVENRSPVKLLKQKQNISQKHEFHEIDERTKELHSQNKTSPSNGPQLDHPNLNNDRVEDEDFDRMQEDLVLKLVIDEETPKAQPPLPSNFDVSGVQVQPPPNLVPPSQEKWYYQDPQGTRQGPFLNVEMAEWYKAGYFSNQLNVMRECDERYFLLGELINLCGGENPFLANMRFPVLKNDVNKMPDEALPYQFMSQMAFRQQVAMRNLNEPWSALTLQQQELAAQRFLLQQQQQQQQPIPHENPFISSMSSSNQFMYMLSQMQQQNKMGGSVMDKPSNNMPSQIDQLMAHQMGNLHSLSGRMPQNAPVNNHHPGANISTLPPDGLGGTLPGIQTPNMPDILSHPGMHGNQIPVGLQPNMNRCNSHGAPDPIPNNPENDPITKFLKQFQQRKLTESLWQKQQQQAQQQQQSQFNLPQPAAAPPSQWPQQPIDKPISMWDVPSPLPEPPHAHEQPILEPNQHEIDTTSKPEKQSLSSSSNDENTLAKELKKRKELEEKQQAKKDADERRKQEQKKQEADKKLHDEKKKKEEERVRKELERAKKDAEEKRLRELEEKRRLKEARKLEEEARKRAEEAKRAEDEAARREAKEREERNRAEMVKLAQSQARAAAKQAPWSQPSSALGMSLGDIQKAEREKRAQEAAILLQKQQEQQLQLQQQLGEKPTGIQLNWATKSLGAPKVKSFAEIQAEEQERLAKMAAEARLAAQLREKDAPPAAASVGSIWNGQSLTWANPNSGSGWASSGGGAGFWDDVPPKVSSKPATVAKSNSTSAMVKPQAVKQQPKAKTKKEEMPKSSVNHNNNQSKDEFTEWCHKTLAAISADVDIPTFVTFLRDIESAYDVRDYCKEYLGESNATQQFATNFLEKRRSFKPKSNAHKDDMCSPAPAITPSVQHSTEFQEVKGKNKKNKKSKMLKIDSRILGFQVTSAPDRINVGDRDYGDNS